jgi:2-C-methyl-D-erythritol 2,4-cyclodiphosphate synthase
MRVGVGYDLHRLVSGRPLVLGGYEIPFEKGLAGHSDADVLTHAIMDAILGALAVGDLGSQFPDTDPAYTDAFSLGLLAEVVQLAHERGYNVGNVDVTVVADAPRLAPHRPVICARLATVLEVNVDCVSVKATTGEGVGPEGRGEAISAHAVVLLVERGARRRNGALGMLE